MTTTPLLDVREVTKSFPGVQALAAVSLEVWPGVVHGVVGENGAGKSTLMRILAGVYQPDAGELRWEGSPIVLANPAMARDRGVSIIYQEFNLFPDLTVAENILFGREPRTPWRTVDWREMNESAERLLSPLASDIAVDAEVRLLSVAQQQLVEIVKALSTDAQLIIMDEPTAALNTTEVEHLFEVIRQLRREGRAVLFVSHRLDEVLGICDVVTVLRDGKLVATRPRKDIDKDEIVRLMVGRSLVETFPPRQTKRSERAILSVDRLSTDQVSEATFTLHAGEILGVAGLEGQGQGHLARALFGLEPVTSGTMTLEGEPIQFRHPIDAINAGVAFVSDDRKGEGLAVSLTVCQNVVLANLGLVADHGLISISREASIANKAIDAVGVRATSIRQEVETLSGGNQQKVILGKWLIKNPRIFVFVEPTRGVDVGAKAEIYRLMRAFTEEGRGIVMVSSDMLELLGMSDRLIVMRGGRISAEMSVDDASEEAVMRAATGLLEPAL